MQNILHIAEKTFKSVKSQQLNERFKIKHTNTENIYITILKSGDHDAYSLASPI